jgi:ABC-2 type transport system ATP-binding protein
VYNEWRGSLLDWKELTQVESAAIETQNLCKTYISFSGQKTVAVDNLSIAIQPGETFGFLGPNGAGKTTTIKILLGLCKASAGSAWVKGQPVTDPRTRAKLGFVPESPYYYDFYKAEELLKFYGRLYGLSGSHLKKRMDECLDLVRLSEFRKTRISYFSRGMLQRIGIAQSLLNDPDLLILDEPTGGLDPIGQMEIRQLLLHLKSLGKTVLLCSHELSKVEVLSDRVAIMNRGKLLTVGKLRDLTHIGAGRLVEVVGLSESEVREAEAKGWTCSPGGEGVEMTIPDEQAVPEALRWILDHKATLVSVRPRTRTLEEVFMSLLEQAGKAGKG